MRSYSSQLSNKNVLTVYCRTFHFGNIRFQLKLRKHAGSKRLNKKIEIFVWSRISKFLRPAQRYDDLNLSESLAKPLVMAKQTEHGIFVKFKKPSKTAVVLLAGVIVKFKKPSKTAVILLAGVTISHDLGYSVPPALHRTIWCRSTFGPRGPGLSNPTSFLRPALPMAPTRDDNARDKRSVLRPNPATFLRDFALYMTMKYAVIRKRCLNHAPCLTVYCCTFHFGNIRFQLKLRKHAGSKRLSSFRNESKLKDGSFILAGRSFQIAGPQTLNDLGPSVTVLVLGMYSCPEVADHNCLRPGIAETTIMLKSVLLQVIR